MVGEEVMSYSPKFQDMPHQTVGKDKMRGKSAFALLMAMRTGKTKTCLDDFGEMELEGEIDDLLVVAPKGSYHTWSVQIPQHGSEDLLDRAKPFVWRTEGGEKHRREFREFLTAPRDPLRPRILVVNIEAIGVEGLPKALVEFASQRRSYAVIDESTIIKNYKAQRTKFILRNIKPITKVRRILSGLPAPRDPLDLYCQFAFLDQRILRCSNFFEFRARYAIMRKILVGRRTVDIVVGFHSSGIEEIAQLIQPHSHRVQLSDIVKLPVSYERLEVEMTPRQRALYATLKKEAIAELAEGSFVTGAMVITRMLRLHQILMGYVMDSQGELREIEENRTQALLDLLEEYDGKAIIWVSYDYSIKKVGAALEKAYGKEAVAYFWGGNSGTRELDDKRFATNPDCRFMLATPGAGGRGRKWDVANLVVYYSNTDNLEHRDQSEERAKDMAKEAKTVYFDLVVPGTVDESFIRAIRDKINLAGAVVGDDFREWLI
jgi:SNF2 family DNA or RNA helicase